MSYQKTGLEIGKLVAEKQAAYGDSFGKSGKVLELLYPDGISPEQYRDALTVVRIVDKLFRIATRKDAFGESPYKDIAGYGLLGVAADEREREGERTFVVRTRVAQTATAPQRTHEEMLAEIDEAVDKEIAKAEGSPQQAMAEALERAAKEGEKTP